MAIKRIPTGVHTWAGNGARPKASYRAARRNEARSRRVEVLKAQSLARNMTRQQIDRERTEKAKEP